MKRFLIASIIIISVFALPLFSLAGQFKVTKVYDGDTVKAEGHDIIIKIRLVGIDTPEAGKGKRKPGQPYSQRAKKYLAGLVLNKTVDVKGYGLGPFNRILGVIYVDGENVNYEMIEAGLAEAYRGKQPQRFDPAPYRQAELQARSTSRGMWSQGDDYISPKAWRKRKK
jgi:micrococcal nuclease